MANQAELLLEGPNGPEGSGPLLTRRDGAESYMAVLFAHLVRPGMTVVDVGAFVGRYTLLAAQRLGPTGRVYAFEPHPATFRWLEHNIARAGFTDRVVAWPYAVGAENTDTSWLWDGGLAGSSLVFRTPGHPGQIAVRAVTLDGVLDPAVPVDLIKLDVEGAEMLALAGMQKTILRASPTLAMFVECFPRGLRAAGAHPGALVARLQGLGFSVQLVDERRQRLSRLGLGALASLRLLAGLGNHWVNLFCTRDDLS